MNDIIGNKYNYLTIMEDRGKTVLCRCDCGNIKEIRKCNVIYSSTTKSCGCYGSKMASDRLKLLRSKDAVPNDTCIINDWWYQFTIKAGYRGLEISVTQQDLEYQFNKQGGLCAISGVVITLPSTWKERRTYKYTASLDRIDNNIGYLKNNIQWVHKIVNKMRMDLTVEEFQYWCKLIANKRNE